MAKKPLARRGLRLSRPDSERFFTVMLVFTHRTFRWSLARQTMLWVVGTVAAFWAIAMIGSGYGFWATKKIMSFSQLQRETFTQQQQLRESLDQAQALDGEIQTLRRQMSDLLKIINPRSPEPGLQPLPAQGEKPMGQEKLGQLRQDLDRTSAEAKVIQTRMDPIIDRWNHTPSIPPTAGYLSSGFGIRLNPFSKINESGDGLLGYHSGMDICNSEGTPIQATADGEVEQAGWMDRYGNGVMIAHSDHVETLYGHMLRVKVKPGQKVSRGDILGLMGHTGNATGVHLHYEVRINGRCVNPQPYMRLQREWLSSLR
jgi:murein DD-endopeptidase MepM/ murein hydrolase activator NlpD